MHSRAVGLGGIWRLHISVKMFVLPMKQIQRFHILMLIFAMSETGWIKPADKTEYDLVTVCRTGAW